MAVTLKVYADDLTTLIGTLDQPYNISWSRELLTSGGGTFTIPHDSPVVAANSDILDPENVVKVEVGGTAVAAWLVRERDRTKGDVWDPVTVSGPDAIELLRQALVYPQQGIAGILQDTRLFAWQSLDYDPDGSWTTPTTLGTYANPTNDSISGTPPVSATDEIQTVTLNAESPPYPWGSDYPSPGGLPGTWTLTHRGVSTSALQWDASLGDIETALEALPHIDGVTVGGTGPTSSFTVTFDGADVSGTQQELLVLGHSQLRHGSQSVVRSTAGDKTEDAEDLLEGWPDPNAVWMGGFGSDWAFRRELRVDENNTEGEGRRLYVSSLGEFDVWWDGEWLGSGTSKDVLKFNVDLTPLDHIIAIQAEAPTIMTMVSLDDEGKPDGIMYRSYGAGGWSPGWQQYVGSPPGVTPGFLVKTLFDEANARGYLPQVSIDFDETNDSTATAWPIDVETGVQVGNDSVLSVAERLRDLDVYVSMAPDFTLSMWHGTRTDRGAGSDSPVTVSVSDVSAVSQVTEDELLTTILARTEDTWVESHNAGPRREGFLSLGTVPTAAGGAAIAAELLEDFASGREAVRWTFYSDQAGVPVPFTGYQIGDVLTTPLLTALTVASWSTGNARVDAIAAEVDDNGAMKLTHEVTPS